MDMRGALKARLTNAPSVAELVATFTPDSNPVPRPAIFWLSRAPRSNLPAITLQMISGDRPQTYDGFQGWREPRVQMNVWASSLEQAAEVLDAAVRVLAPRETSNGIKFDAMGFENEGDSTDDTSTTTIYRTRIDLLVRHEPA